MIAKQIYLLKNFFIYGCVGSSLLCMGLSSCGEWGLVRGLLIPLAYPIAEHGL